MLQHRFWDLLVNEERFEVKLTFDGIPERLVVPFAAIKVFFDPSVPYGLQFEGSDLATDPTQDLGSEGLDALDVAPRFGASGTRKDSTQAESSPTTPSRAEKKVRSPRKPRAAKGEAGGEPSAKPLAGTEASGSSKGARPKVVTTKPDQPEAPANDTKVVQLDKFRKK